MTSVMPNEPQNDTALAEAVLFFRDSHRLPAPPPRNHYSSTTRLREPGPALRPSGRLLVSLQMAREVISTPKKSAARTAGERLTRVHQNATPEPITSRDNRWIKLFREALREGFLSGQNLIGIEGPHLVGEAL